MDLSLFSTGVGEDLCDNLDQFLIIFFVVFIDLEFELVDGVPDHTRWRYVLS